MVINRDYQVKFIANHFDMNVYLLDVKTVKEDEIIAAARDLMEHHYGLDPVGFAEVDIEIQEG